MIDLIHIGDYKTGTTWFQEYAFKQHPELIYVDDPEKFPDIAALFYVLVDARDLDFDAATLRERFAKEIDKIDRRGKKLVVSREALSGHFLSGEHAKRIAERLHQVFGPVKILLVIREQFSMLASIYSQYVKIGGTLTLRDFVFDPFVSSELLHRLQYEKLLAAYREIFGADRIMVKLYEEFRSDNFGFFKDVLVFVGCDNIYFQPTVDKRGINLSLTTFGLSVQRWLNRLARTHYNSSANVLPLDKLIAPFISEKKKERLLLSARVQMPSVPLIQKPQVYLCYSINMALNYRFSIWCEKIRLGGKIEIPLDVKDQIKEVLVPTNKILADKYGLEVGKYGWVL